MNLWTPTGPFHSTLTAWIFIHTEFWLKHVCVCVYIYRARSVTPETLCDKLQQLHWDQRVCVSEEDFTCAELSGFKQSPGVFSPSAAVSEAGENTRLLTKIIDPRTFDPKHFFTVQSLKSPDDIMEKKNWMFFPSRKKSSLTYLYSLSFYQEYRFMLLQTDVLVIGFSGQWWSVIGY